MLYHTSVTLLRSATTHQHIFWLKILKLEQKTWYHPHKFLRSLETPLPLAASPVEQCVLQFNSYMAVEWSGCQHDPSKSGKLFVFICVFYLSLSGRLREDIVLGRCKVYLNQNLHWPAWFKHVHTSNFYSFFFFFFPATGIGGISGNIFSSPTDCIPPSRLIWFHRSPPWEVWPDCFSENSVSEWELEHNAHSRYHQWPSLQSRHTWFSAGRSLSKGGGHVPSPGRGRLACHSKPFATPQFPLLADGLPTAVCAR